MAKYTKILGLILFFAACFFSGSQAEEALTWGDCIKEAAKNHPDLIAAQESVKQSSADKDATASALTC